MNNRRTRRNISVESVPFEECDCGCIKCATEIQRLRKELEEKIELNQKLLTRLSVNTSPVNTPVPGSPGTPRRGAKGCTCKGRCLAKCGCTKKGIKCSISCKCNKDSCENQENEEDEKKENEPNGGIIEIKEPPLLEITKSTDIQENQITEDEDFNPMKPRKQLPRSPIQNAHNLEQKDDMEDVAGPAHLTTNQSILNDITNINVSLAQQTLKDDDDVPDDMKQPVVDWEEHKAQLKECPKCKRKFFPTRLQKHMSNCKMI